MANIKKLQEILKLEQTGFIDNFTIAALKNYQLRCGLFPSGVLDDKTIEKIKIRESVDLKEIEETKEIKDMNLGNFTIPNISTDMSERLTDIKIVDSILPDNEYIKSKNKKTTIFLHHTAGNSNPYATIKDWDMDTRGQIGTAYVIGGPRIGNMEYDGLIVRAFDDEYHAYHLGNDKGKPLPGILTTASIGIEICNFGWLQKVGNSYMTYVNSRIDEKDVILLDKPFRGYQYWHNYSDNQIKSIIQLLKYLEKEHNIDIKAGLTKLLKNASTTDDIYKAFDLNSSLINGTNINGVWSHTNVRKEKFDIYPHPKLVEALKKL